VAALTRYPISTKTGSTMGRRKKNFDNMSAGFPAGTFDQMDAVLRPGETRKDALREAVQLWIAMRKKQQPKPKKD